MLLDTHLALWTVADAAQLKVREREIIEAEDEIIVSVVSIWEIAIKHRLQRGRANDMPIPGREAQRLFEQAGFSIVPVTARHAAAVDDLPPLHGDPFDRMLIAQAVSEPMYLLTRDARLKDYGALVVVV